MSQVKILIADDDPVVHESLGIYLKAEGYIPISVYDGKAALENATSDISLFVLDIMMPQLSGIDVCKEIRKTSQVPIIMLTAKGEEIDRIIGLELGADDYIVKPFSPREVVARIKTVLRRSVEHEVASSRTVSIGGLQIDIAIFRNAVRQTLSAHPKTKYYMQLVRSGFLARAAVNAHLGL